MMFPIALSSSGASSQAATKPDEHPADHPVERVQPVLEPRDHAEVAAAAAQRPEEVRVGVLVGAEHPSVGGHDVGREDVVDGQAERPGEVADAAPERDPGDPDGAGVAEADGEPVLGRRSRELSGGQAGLGPHGAGTGVDVDGLHVAKVDDQAPVDRAVRGVAVAAAADGQRDTGLRGVAHRLCDVVVVDRSSDGGGTWVGAAHHHPSGGVVVGVVGREDGAGEPRAQLLGVDARLAGLQCGHASDLRHRARHNARAFSRSSCRWVVLASSHGSRHPLAHRRDRGQGGLDLPGHKAEYLRAVAEAALDGLLNGAELRDPHSSAAVDRVRRG
jgi:hypothetical protein